MHQVREFTRSEYRERNDLDGLCIAAAKVMFQFAQLEEELNSAVADLLELAAPLDEIVPRAMRFDAKVQALGAMVRARADEPELFNTAGEDPVVWFRALAEQAMKAEAFKDRVFGSTHPAGYHVWRHITNGPDGATVEDEPMDADLLYDISDYILDAALDIEEFFLLVEDHPGKERSAADAGD